MIVPMRIGMVAAAVVVTIAAVAAAGGVASAQPANKADALFDEGRALLEQGKYKEACAAFEASLAEADAIGTRLNLALCEEKRGRIYTAVLKFEDTAARAERSGQLDSAKVAREHATALRPRVPTLVITFAERAPGEKVVIRRQGLADRQIDTSGPIEVDPTDPNDATDTLVIVASAEGYLDYASPEITLVEGTKKKAVEIPALARADRDTGPGPVTPSGGGSGRRKRGFIVGGIGVAAVIGATVWAKVASDNAGDNCRNPDGEIDYSCGDAVQLRYGATGLAAVGLAAVGLGVYWVLTPHKGERRTALVPAVGPDGGGIVVRGSF
jgi:hypothetical protein